MKRRHRRPITILTRNLIIIRIMAGIITGRLRWYFPTAGAGVAGVAAGMVVRVAGMAMLAGGTVMLVAAGIAGVDLGAAMAVGLAAVDAVKTDFFFRRQI